MIESAPWLSGVPFGGCFGLLFCRVVIIVSNSSSVGPNEHSFFIYRVR